MRLSDFVFFANRVVIFFLKFTFTLKASVTVITVKRYFIIN